LQLEHFVDVIRGTASPSCSGEEGLRALIVCEAVQKAMRSGQPVDIDVDLLKK
jgi:predicted dehydrogenase